MRHFYSMFLHFIQIIMSYSIIKSIKNIYKKYLTVYIYRLNGRTKDSIKLTLFLLNLTTKYTKIVTNK